LHQFQGKSHENQRETGAKGAENERVGHGGNFLAEPLDLWLAKKLNISGYPQRGGKHAVLP
jgi:hypothetical protein